MLSELFLFQAVFWRTDGSEISQCW